MSSAKASGEEAVERQPADGIGIGLVGAGFIGRVHARCVTAHPRARLVAVHDADRGRATELAAQHGAATAPTLEALLADRSIRLVIIATSTDSHGAIARACIAAGMAFMCEKPIDTDFASAVATARAAREAGAFAGMAFNRRYDRQHALVKQAVDAGEVGDIETMHLLSRTQSPPPLAYVATSGGMLRDKGAHFFDLACWIAGERPVEIFAAGACLIDPRYADHGDVDTAMIILKMAGGALCHFDFSRRTAYGYDERIEIAGSAGMMQSRPPHPVDVALYRGETARVRGLHQTWYPRSADTYPAQMAALVEAIENDADFAGLEDGLVAEAIAAAGMRSMRECRVVAIDYDF